MHFIGIGGIGMSALARYFNQKGVQISGYDRTETELTRTLESEGMDIHYQDAVELIPSEIRKDPDSKGVMVVYTPAVPADTAQRRYFEEKGISTYKRAEVLGMVASSLETLAVAGTHGKTTTTSILSMIMKEGGLDFVSFVGGINENMASNLISQGKARYFLAEADEYDRSFLHLHPSRAILTSLDPDHLDIYGDRESMIETYRTFCAGVKEELWIHEGLSGTMKTVRHRTYGTSENCEARAANIRTSGRDFTFDFSLGDVEIRDLHLGMPGYHNVENCTAAIALSLGIGVQADDIRKALSQYSGVKRRFEYHINRPDLIYIDDYAHHPTEIDAVVSSIRKMYPGKRITGMFQPHLYSRTRDFGDEFARSLEKLDEVILLDIYPAREKPIPGIDSNWLLKKIGLPQKEVCTKAELIKRIEARKPEIILTIGAGDIDQMVVPIAEHFKSVKA